MGQLCMLLCRHTILTLSILETWHEILIERLGFPNDTASFLTQVNAQCFPSGSMLCKCLSTKLIKMPLT